MDAIAPAFSSAALAARINAEHDLAQSKEQQAVEHYRKVGLMLLNAKKGCAHGEWLAWLKKNVRFKERKARYCMELAKSAPGADLVEDWQKIRGRTENEGAENGEAADASADKLPAARPVKLVKCRDRGQGPLTQNGVVRKIELALVPLECHHARTAFSAG
jgi:hypothetical protein